MSYFLETKLRPPDIQLLLLRPRLINKAKTDGEVRLVVICADPGYGKTTLMAQLYSYLPGIGVWYRFDDSDDTPADFILHLTKGVCYHSPPFGYSVTKMLRDISDASASADENNTLLAAFINELEHKIPGPVSFYFDNFQFINNNELITQSVQFLLKHLPDHCRVYVASRERPSLPLGRLRVEGKLKEISREDLAFSLEETAKLFWGCCQQQLTDREIEAWHKRTNGWPVALSLSRRFLDTLHRTAEDILPLLLKKSGAIEQYLTKEIWEGLDEELKWFFMQSSLIEPVEADICDLAIPGKRTAVKKLNEAVDRHIMTSSLQRNKAYVYHPFFQEFLEEKLKQNLAAAEVAKLHYRYAVAYKEKGNLDKAIHHYLKAGDKEQAAGLIEASAEGAIKSGEIELVVGWLKKIPRDYREKKAGLCLVMAQLNQYCGHLQAALRDITTAASLLKESNDLRRLYKCAIVKSHLLDLLERHQESLAAANEALPLAGSREEKAWALSQAAAQTAALGYTQKAMKLWGKAQALCDKSWQQAPLVLEISALALLHFKGDYKRLLIKVRKLLENSDVSALPMHYRFYLLFYFADSLFETCKYDEALHLISEAEKYVGNSVYKLLLERLAGQIRLYIKNEETGSAEQSTEVINSSNHSSNSSQAKLFGYIYSISRIGTWNRQKGLYAEALQTHLRGLTSSKRDKNLYAIASFLVNIGADKYTISKGTNGGESEINAAYAIAHKYGYQYIKTQVYFHQAGQALALGKKEMALAQIKKSLELARRYGHHHFIVQEGKANINLLAFAFANDIQRRYLIGIFKKIGQESLPLLIPLLQSKSTRLKKAAISAVAAAGGRATVSWIRPLLKDKDKEVAKAAARELAAIRSSISNPLEIITKREAQVLALVAQGWGNAKIAEYLQINEPTVKTHITNIFRKLGLSKRVQAAAYFHKVSKAEKELQKVKDFA